MNAQDALKLPEDQFWLEVSRVITPGPWSHSYSTDLEGCCLRCGTQISNGVEWLNASGQPCPVPPSLTDSPEVLAFRLRDEISDRAELLRAVHVVSRLLCAERDADLWYAYQATPREQVACALVALGLWEVTP